MDETYYQPTYEEEVERKSLAAIEQLINEYESGLLTADAAQIMLNILQTAYSGLVPNKPYLEIMTDFSIELDAQPHCNCVYIWRYLSPDDDKIVTITVTDNKQVTLIHHSDKSNKQKSFDAPKEAAAFSNKLQNQLLSAGYTLIEGDHED